LLQISVSRTKETAVGVMTETWTNLLRGREGHGRSFIKAVSWRTVGTIDTFIISFFVTGKVSIAGSIASIEVVTKILIYYLHERAWAMIPWGVDKPRSRRDQT
jgi:uncharacterized membrane protein